MLAASARRAQCLVHRVQSPVKVPIGDHRMSRAIRVVTLSMKLYRELALSALSLIPRYTGD